MIGDCERERREKEDSFAKMFVDKLGEKANVFSSVFQTFSMLARGDDFVGALGVGGGGIRFALRDVRRGEGVWGV